MFRKFIINFSVREFKPLLVLFSTLFVNILFSQKQVLFSQTDLIVKFKPAVIHTYQKGLRHKALASKL